MQFVELGIEGGYVIKMDPIEDERGFFSRLYCSEQFREIGIDQPFVQINNSFSKERGTLRGLHYQLTPFEEVKLVRVVQGKIYDLVLDLRPSSTTYMEWRGVDLSAKNREMVIVPKGCAHGFYTLEPNSELLYMVSAKYSHSHERGIRWNDPTFRIEWPGVPSVISERDRLHPLFVEEAVR